MTPSTPRSLLMPLLAAATTVAAGDCHVSTNGQPCTEEFRVVYVMVLDTLGAAAPDVATTHTVPRNGLVLAVPQDPVLTAAGVYVVLTDAHRTALLQSGDVVRLTGTKGPMAFTADFRFDVPQGCHIRKMAGPDTVSLQ